MVMLCVWRPYWFPTQQQMRAKMMNFQHAWTFVPMGECIAAAAYFPFCVEVNKSTCPNLRMHMN